MLSVAHDLSGSMSNLIYRNRTNKESYMIHGERFDTIPNVAVKIKHCSRKRSHKLDGIGVGGIRTFLFSSVSVYD